MAAWEGRRGRRKQRKGKGERRKEEEEEGGERETKVHQQGRTEEPRTPHDHKKEWAACSVPRRKGLQESTDPRVQSVTRGEKTRLTCTLLVRDSVSQEGHKQLVKAPLSGEKNRGALRGALCALSHLPPLRHTAYITVRVTRRAAHIRSTRTESDGDLNSVNKQQTRSTYRA